VLSPRAEGWSNSNEGVSRDYRLGAYISYRSRTANELKRKLLISVDANRMWSRVFFASPTRAAPPTWSHQAAAQPDRRRSGKRVSAPTEKFEETDVEGSAGVFSLQRQRKGFIFMDDKSYEQCTFNAKTLSPIRVI